MSLIEDIRKDREAGTDGPWSAFTDDTAPHTNIVSPTPVTACVFSLSGRHKHEADVQRIARVPQMEAALLAAEELADAFEAYQNAAVDHMDFQIEAEAALAAYRAATGAA